MEVVPIEFPGDMPFYLWLEKLRKARGNPVIDGFAIVNKYIHVDDAITIAYSLN